MSQVSHFQVYSQRENHVTNNTLLMLRHVHRVSAALFESVLQACIDGEVNIGPRFVQQQGESNSVPDALISQEPFYLYVEAKPFISLSEEQIVRHLKSIANRNHPRNTAIFLVISNEKLPDSHVEKIQEQCDSKSIRFAATTYTDLIATLDKVCENQSELAEILEDFKAFIGQQGLLPEQHRWLVGMLCGTSWKENIEFGAYFEPAHRNAKWTNAKFLGIYRSKHISHIGVIEASAVCRVVDGQLGLEELEFNNRQPDALTEEQGNRIKEIAVACERHFGKFAQEPHRFYLMDDFTETNIVKESSGGMMGHRYFDLFNWVGAELISPETAGHTVAKLVRGKSFT